MFGDEVDDGNADNYQEELGTGSPAKAKISRVIPTSSEDVYPSEEEREAQSEQYVDARSIVIAASLASLSDGDIDAIIDEHEADSDEKLTVAELEDLIMERVEEELPVSDIIKEQPHLEFDLAGMSQRELASVYREQVADLVSLGSEVVGRKLDYSHVESLIGHAPPPPADVDEDDEFNMSGTEYTVGQWGTFNSSLRAALLLLAYQHSDLDTAAAILRLIRHIFRINSDEGTEYEDLDKFVEFATLAVYEDGPDAENSLDAEDSVDSIDAIDSQDSLDFEDFDFEDSPGSNTDDKASFAGEGDSDDELDLQGRFKMTANSQDDRSEESSFLPGDSGNDAELPTGSSEIRLID